MSILGVQNGERGNGLNTESHKHKVKCRHQRKGQSQHSFANQRIIITRFLAQPSQQLNINKLVAPSCALSFSYHHRFPSLHSIFLCFVFLSFPWIQTAQFTTAKKDKAVPAHGDYGLNTLTYTFP